MDPTNAFCNNPDCPTRGQVGQGNIKVHSYKEQRLRCTTCRKTFAASTGTPFYRLHQGRSDNEAFILAATRPAPSLARIAPELPVDVIALVDKSLAWEPNNRFESAAAMRKQTLALLDKYRGGAPEPAPLTQRPGSPSRLVDDAPPSSAHAPELSDDQAKAGPNDPGPEVPCPLIRSNLRQRSSAARVSFPPSFGNRRTTSFCARFRCCTTRSQSNSIAAASSTYACGNA